MEVREIGIEKECFLMRGNEIMEPGEYGFPHDEFEFLIELRSLPSDRLYPVYTTLMQEQLQNSLRANKFNMQLVDDANKMVDSDWVVDLWNKYALYRFDNSDYTKNIYGSTKNSHHFGVLDLPQGKRLTAGIHVHFSSRDSETGKVINLPIEDIVRKMDTAFEHDIKYAGRNLGEWEPKTHGFEYRSLPGNADVYKVLKVAFKILREA